MFFIFIYFLIYFIYLLLLIPNYNLNSNYLIFKETKNIYLKKIYINI
jgi:hypothetical protein